MSRGFEDLIACVQVTGCIINKENPDLFLLQSFFHLVWEETNVTVDGSKESTSQKRKFPNLQPE